MSPAGSSIPSKTLNGGVIPNASVLHEQPKDGIMSIEDPCPDIVTVSWLKNRPQRRKYRSKRMDCEVRYFWLCYALAVYVGFGLFSLPRPRFPYLYNGDNHRTCSTELLWTFHERTTRNVKSPINEMLHQRLRASKSLKTGIVSSSATQEGQLYFRVAGADVSPSFPHPCLLNYTLPYFTPFHL